MASIQQELLEKQTRNLIELSEKIKKCLNFSEQCLTKYYDGGGEDNGMRYRGMLKIYDYIENALTLFEEIDEKVMKELRYKQNTNKVSVPKRKVD